MNLQLLCVCLAALAKCSTAENTPANYVVELTDDNFDELVFNSDDIWMVEFYTQWCKDCGAIAPHWAAAALQLNGKVKLGALNATKHSSKARELNVSCYPSVKFFPAYTTYVGGAEEYTDGLSRSSPDRIVKWALEKYRQKMSHKAINKHEFYVWTENGVNDPMSENRSVVNIAATISDVSIDAASVRNIRVTLVKASEIALSWDPPLPGNDQDPDEDIFVQEYEVMGYPFEGKIDEVNAITKRIEDEYVTFNELRPRTDYVFQVRARIDSKWGVYSPKFYVFKTTARLLGSSENTNTADHTSDKNEVEVR